VLADCIVSFLKTPSTKLLLHSKRQRKDR